MLWKRPLAVIVNHAFWKEELKEPLKNLGNFLIGLGAQYKSEEGWLSDSKALNSYKANVDTLSPPAKIGICTFFIPMLRFLKGLSTSVYSNVQEEKVAAEGLLKSYEDLGNPVAYTVLTVHFIQVSDVSFIQFRYVTFGYRPLLDALAPQDEKAMPTGETSPVKLPLGYLKLPDQDKKATPTGEPSPTQRTALLLRLFSNICTLLNNLSRSFNVGIAKVGAYGLRLGYSSFLFARPVGNWGSPGELADLLEANSAEVNDLLLPTLGIRDFRASRLASALFDDRVALLLEEEDSAERLNQRGFGIYFRGEGTARQEAREADVAAPAETAGDAAERNAREGEASAFGVLSVVAAVPVRFFQGLRQEYRELVRWLPVLQMAGGETNDLRDTVRLLEDIKGPWVDDAFDQLYERGGTARTFISQAQAALEQYRQSLHTAERATETALKNYYFAPFLDQRYGSQGLEETLSSGGLLRARVERIAGQVDLMAPRIRQEFDDIQKELEDEFRTREGRRAQRSNSIATLAAVAAALLAFVLIVPELTSGPEEKALWELPLGPIIGPGLKRWMLLLSSALLALAIPLWFWIRPIRRLTQLRRWAFPTTFHCADAALQRLYHTSLPSLHAWATFFMGDLMPAEQRILKKRYKEDTQQARAEARRVEEAMDGELAQAWSAFLCLRDKANEAMLAPRAGAMSMKMLRDKIEYELVSMRCLLEIPVPDMEYAPRAALLYHHLSARPTGPLNQPILRRETVERAFENLKTPVTSETLEQKWDIQQDEMLDIMTNATLEGKRRREAYKLVILNYLKALKDAGVALFPPETDPVLR